jgi:hypothetical protein
MQTAATWFVFGPVSGVYAVMVNPGSRAVVEKADAPEACLRAPASGLPSTGEAGCRPAKRAGAARRSWRSQWILLSLVCLGLVVPRLARGQGTVAEQRARLPPPATCEDPVEGVWRSHQFHETWEEWGIFTLEIRRIPGSDTALTGRIINRSWYADATVSEPGNCQGQLDYLVTMQAVGEYREGTVRFGGTSWELNAVYCGSSFGFAYNLDRFSGVIDPELQEFQSVNNDGGRYIDVPTVFRRVECFETPPAPSITVEPPPFVPDLDRPGCLG